MGLRSLRRTFALFLPFLFAACARDAHNPYELAPENPYSSWTPMQGNQIISSKYCRTLLPAHFQSAELSLSELLDIALQNNPTTKQSWAQARAAAAQYGTSLSSFYPSVGFSGFYYRQRAGFPETGIPSGAPGTPATLSVGGNIPNSVTESYFSEAGPDVTLSYILFDFGQRSAASLAAREGLYYADLQHNQQIQNVLQTVMYDYYNYLYQIALLKAFDADLKNAEMALDAANEKFSLGLVALGDVAQERTQYLQSKMNVTSQKQMLENAFAQLAVDLGLPANLRFEVQPLPEEIVAAPILEGVDRLVEQAQAQRQDFLAAQANLKSKEAALLGAKRASLPVINSQLSTGRYWYNKDLYEKENHWTATLSLSFPIFQGYYFQNQVRNAEAELALSQATLLQTELTLIQNVTTARMQVETAASNLNDSYEYLKAAEVQFDVAFTSYQSGTATILDVLQAQSSLADARSKKALAQKNWFLSLAQIAYATGSLCAPLCERS